MQQWRRKGEADLPVQRKTQTTQTGHDCLTLFEVFDLAQAPEHAHLEVWERHLQLRLRQDFAAPAVQLSASCLPCLTAFLANGDTANTSLPLSTTTSPFLLFLIHRRSYLLQFQCSYNTVAHFNLTVSRPHTFTFRSHVYHGVRERAPWLRR